MLGHLDGHDLARVIQRNLHLERCKARHVVGRSARFAAIAAGGSLRQRVVDGVARQGCAGLHIDLRGGDVLTDQRVEHGGVSNQVSAEARRLIVLGHLDGHDLARVVHRDFDLHRAKAGHIVGTGGHDRLCVAGSRRCRGEDRFLVAGLRLNAQRALGIGQHLGHSVHERRGGNRRAADGIHIVAQGIRVSCDGHKLILELRIAHARAKACGLLQRADIHLRHTALGAHAQRDRNRAAVALRVRHQGIALELACGIRRSEQLRNHAAFGQAFRLFHFIIFASGQHGIERCQLRGNPLLLNRPLGHFVGHRQQHGSHEREDEETKRELENITHYFLTSPKLLAPVTRSISGDTTFISRMANEHHSAGVFLQQRNQNSSRPQPRPKISLPLLVAGEDE